ncbi:MAG: ATP-binding protein, partial [Haloarculaceae archaeon]
ALAALLGAVDGVAADGADRVRDGDLAVGRVDVPRPSVSLARVLALPANRQRVLRALVAVDPDRRGSVDDVTDAVAADPAVELSSSTIKRFLYELAEAGVLERVRADPPGHDGRPPSRLEPRFPTRAFRRLFDARGE